MKKALTIILTVCLVLTLCVGCNSEIDLTKYSVTVKTDDKTLYVGDTYSMQSLSVATDSEILWSSTNDIVASVDNNGNIIANNVGTATITAQFTSTIGAEITTKCKITVIAHSDSSDAKASSLTESSSESPALTSYSANNTSVETSTVVAGSVSGTVFTITYVANNGTDTFVVSKEYNSEEMVTIASASELGFSKAREDNNNNTRGYSFAGWNLQANGTGGTVLAGEQFAIGRSFTLYAQWQGWTQLWEGSPKFAEFNVGALTDTYNGASISTQYTGGLYSWGGTEDRLRAEDHYNNKIDNYVLDSANDTASQIWGSNWRMMTVEEFTSLVKGANITCTWVAGEGSNVYTDGCNLAGYKISGMGNTIFLPVTGIYNKVSKMDNLDKGMYWTSSSGKNAWNVNTVTVKNSTPYISNLGVADIGYAVRAICID